jgi:hypothetical protein
LSKIPTMHLMVCALSDQFFAVRGQIAATRMACTGCVPDRAVVRPNGLHDHRSSARGLHARLNSPIEWRAGGLAILRSVEFDWHTGERFRTIAGFHVHP